MQLKATKEGSGCWGLAGCLQTVTVGMERGLASEARKLVVSVHAGSSSWGLVPMAQRLVNEWLIDKGQWTPLKLEIELPTGIDMAMVSTLLFQWKSLFGKFKYYQEVAGDT